MAEYLKFTIKRVSNTSAGVFGVILFQGIPFALTAERPWLDNKSNVSCIPEGMYRCKRVDSPRFGNTFEVTNVPNRTHILFHKGNVPTEDSHGCILIGEMFDYLGDRPAVLSSKKGFEEYLHNLKGVDEHYIVIENRF